MTGAAALSLLALGCFHASAALGQETSKRPTRWSAPSLQDTSRLLYKGYGYGSDAYFSPVSVLLNKGYDIFQLRHSPRNIYTFPYRATWGPGIRDVWKYPDAAVQRFGGWRRFTRVELLPLSWRIDDMNWFVNYTEHLTGGGLTMRMLDEWYRAHEVPWPRVMAMLTTYGASILNEISEQPGVLAPSPGAVADLLFFDLGAVLLFQWDQPTRFLAHTLQIADWSNQASFTSPNRQLQNNGQYFSLKIPIGLERTRLFVRGGMGAQVGLSRTLSDDGSGARHVSVSVGGDTEVREIDASGHETVGFAPGAGVFLDRNNSLLWSVTSSPAENLLALNIYPGVLRGPLNGSGVWAVYTRRNELRFGITHRRALGLGVGYGR